MGSSVEAEIQSKAFQRQIMVLNLLVPALCVRFLKKLKIESPYGPTSPLLCTYPNERWRCWRDTCTPLSMQIYSQWPGYRIVHQWMRGKRHVHNVIPLTLKIEEHYVICDTVNEPGRHHVKWNKPSIKSKHHMILVMHSMKKANS